MKFTKFSIMFILFAFCLHMHASPVQDSSPNVDIPITEIPDSDDETLKPKMPSRQRICCTYDGEMLFIKFAISEGECTLCLESSENGTQIQYLDSSAPAYINVGKVENANLLILTSSGHTYIGCIY